MTAPRRPSDLAADVFIHAPLGLAMAAAEMFPSLSAKGRRELASRRATATMVGRVATEQGLNLLKARVGSLLDTRRPASTGPASTGPASTGPASTGPASTGPASTGPASTGPASTGPASTGPASVAPMEPGIRADTSEQESAGTEPTWAEVLPGYDSLAASQIVARLGALGPVELRAISARESAGRSRRSILRRIDQLLDAPPDGH